MIPDCIYNEIDSRLRIESLHRSKAKAICRTLGINFDQTLETLPAIDEAAAALRRLVPAGADHEGAVWFEFVTGTAGIERKVSGRIVFVTTPYAIDGTQGHMVSKCQALVWRAEESVPLWLPFPEEMLPAQLLEQTYQEIDALATAKSRADIC